MSHPVTLYWSKMTYKTWGMFLTFTNKGIAYIGSPNKSFSEVEIWAKRKFPTHKLKQNDALAKPYVKEITAYLDGNIKTFSVPIDLPGTDFQLAVWNALINIPYGDIHTYTDVAEAINHPKAVRAVGAAIGANPLLMIVPCHRVIAKSGALAGFRAGLTMKKRLIELERTTF